MGASLLTRIAHAAAPSSTGRHTYRDHDTLAAILKNLSDILNTRQGSALTCPDYGIIDVGALVHDFPDAIGVIQRAIKNTIVVYEPRLKNVQVRHVDGAPSPGLMIDFEISAQFWLPDGTKQAVRFATAVNRSGDVKVT